MIQVFESRLPVLAILLVPVLGCDLGAPEAFETESIFNSPLVLDAENPRNDYSFRICKAGAPTETVPTGEVVIETTGKEGEVIIEQWALVSDYDAGEPSTERGRVTVGESGRAPIELSVPLQEPGEACGPWSVFTLTLESNASTPRVDITGSFFARFEDQDAPLDDFYVEMPHH